MKDAKGHGSNPRGTHAAGVDNVGQPKEYSWTKLPHGGHVLAHKGNLADQVGHVMPQTQQNGTRMYVGRYSYSNSSGNAPSGYSHHGSVPGAKKYVESNLAKFWEPPKVKS